MTNIIQQFPFEDVEAKGGFLRQFSEDTGQLLFIKLDENHQLLSCTTQGCLNGASVASCSYSYDKRGWIVQARCWQCTEKMMKIYT
jgi:hypothetical protein